MSFLKGDTVLVTYDGRTVEATIELVSRNQRSLALRFEAILGGYVGTMAVIADGTRGYKDLLHGQPVEVRPLEA